MKSSANNASECQTDVGNLVEFFFTHPLDCERAAAEMKRSSFNLIHLCIGVQAVSALPSNRPRALTLVLKTVVDRTATLDRDVRVRCRRS